MSNTHATLELRRKYLLLLVITIPIGLLSRHLPFDLSKWTGKYPGDVLYATMLYWIARIAAPRSAIRTCAIFTVALCFCIELLKFWHALDPFRDTSLGALLLGRGFHLFNLVCYVVGALIGVWIDKSVVVRKEEAVP